MGRWIQSWGEGLRYKFASDYVECMHPSFSYYLQIILLLLVYLYTSNILYTDNILPGINVSLSNLKFFALLRILSVGMFSSTKWSYSILDCTKSFTFNIQKRWLSCFLGKNNQSPLRMAYIHICL